jgi:hypothetical protein
MSTYQPPGEPPSYAQPQDPWAGTQGVASAPTDPIPQTPQQYGQFAPGVAAPSVWTQETISHGGYDYVPQERSRLGMYVLIILAVIVFGGGGGYGAYRWISSLNPPETTVDPTSSTGTSPSTGSTSPGELPQVDPASIKVGECIYNTTPDDPATQAVTAPTMVRVGCAVPAGELLKLLRVPDPKPDEAERSYTVIKVTSGEQIPEGATGSFDEVVTAPAMCAGTGYEAFYGWDSRDDTKDFFFCLTIN